MLQNFKLFDMSNCKSDMTPLFHLFTAVDVMVVSVIGVDNSNKMVYGVGNNKQSYMKYVPGRGKWYSISHHQWKQASLSGHEVVTIEDSDTDELPPAGNKQKHIANGEKWGGIISIFLCIS